MSGYIGAGANRVDVQMQPISGGGSGPFTYSGASLDANWNVGQTVYRWLRYVASIRNPNNAAITKNVTMMYNMKRNGIGGYYDTTWQFYWSKTYPITLQPGQQITFDSCQKEGITGSGYAGAPSGGSGTAIIMDGIAVQGWLEDSDGNKSALLEIDAIDHS